MSKPGIFTITNLSGGRNRTVSPSQLPANQCVEAINVEWWNSPVGRRRNGSSDQSGSGWSITSPAYLTRWVPSTDDTVSELWGYEGNTNTLYRRVGSAAWTSTTLKDATTSSGDIMACGFNAKLFWAYKTSANTRLHVWDGSTVRRTGLAAATAAPTVANTGAGAYPATPRIYRVRWQEKSGSTVLRQSEASPSSTTFTPSGAGAAARVTQPTPPNEGETHWVIEATDYQTFYQIATVAIGTTTYDDSALTSTYASNTVSPLTGAYTLQKAYRFIAADQGRLIGFGSFLSTDRQNDIEISALAGTGSGDDERVDTTNTYRYTLDESDSGAPRGLVGPLFGNFYAFKQSQIWELAPTGIPANPYRVTPISKAIGAVSPNAICMGEDETGNPCLYFLSERGLYRFGIGGLEWLGQGLEDYYNGTNGFGNLLNTPAYYWTQGWTIFYPRKRQVYVAFVSAPTDSAIDYANKIAIYDIRSGGWALTSGLTPYNNACLYPRSSAVTTRPRDLRIYMPTGTSKILELDDENKTVDVSTDFTATIITAAFEPGGVGYRGQMGDVLIAGPARIGSTITVSAAPDFDSTYAKSGSASLAATGSETRVQRRVSGTAVGRAQFVQLTITDVVTQQPWVLDRIAIPFSKQEPVTA